MTTDTSKAPERIRVDPDFDGYNQQVIGWAYDRECEDMIGWTEYVRSDIHAAMQARAEKAEGALIVMARSLENTCDAGVKAIAERDALRAENERLREALRPFAEYMQTDEGRIDLDNLGNDLPDNDGVGWVYLTHGDFRAARAALERKEGKT